MQVAEGNPPDRPARPPKIRDLRPILGNHIQTGWLFPICVSHPVVGLPAAGGGSSSRMGNWESVKSVIVCRFTFYARKSTFSRVYFFKKFRKSPRADILFTTLFRLNLSVAFLKSFGHKSAADIHLCDTFKAVQRISRTYFFKKLVFRKRAQICEICAATYLHIKVSVLVISWPKLPN